MSYPKTHAGHPGAIIIEGHVQGLSNTRSLGELGIPVIVVDTGPCVARHSRFCKAFFRCPAYDSDELADFLLELADTQALDGWLLLPSNDHAVQTVARNRSRLGARFVMTTPEQSVLRNIYDKSRLLNLADSVGIPIPGAYYPSEEQSFQSIPLTFPVLTRGRYGLDFYKATGRKAFLAEDLDAYVAQLEKIGKAYSIDKVLTQELIPDCGTNKTVSFAAFCVKGAIKAHWMGEKVRQHPLQFGTATFARSVNVPDCLAHSIPLLRALEYTGICEIEYLQDPRDGQYKLIEINARTWLWVGLAKACGVDFARLAYEYVNAEGGDIEYPAGYDTGVCWVNPITDTVYAFKAILTRQLGLKNYLVSFRSKKNVNALFVGGDWKPGLAYLHNAFFYLQHR